MAVQPPLPATPQAAAPAPPKKSGCAGCSMGCLGCLGVVVILVLLLATGGYFFIVAQANAGVASPAALLVATDPVEVGHNDSGYQPAKSGQSLDAGTSVRTGATGRATIQFPDGSLTRLAPDTTVTIQAAQLNSAGSLKSATLAEKIGRTLSVVQKLAGGASFSVGGHSVSAQVRGTQFEVVVNADFSNVFKVFDGTVVVSGQTTVTLHAGQQVGSDPNGRLGAPGALGPDSQDPYALDRQCTNAVSQGTTAGTVQTTVGGPISTDQSAEVDYNSAGGTVTVALCWPGSFMTLTVTDPTGTAHSSRSASGTAAHIAGPPGLWRAIVHAVDASNELFAVSFATDAGCSGETVDSGGFVRQILSNGELARNLSQSGSSGITVQVQGTSPTSARVYYSYSGSGLSFSWTIDFYAATPDLGFVFTQVIVNGVNITTQLVSRLNAAGAAVTSVPQDYVVDRVYSCNGPDGDTMIIEGHH
jgi:hypothetical protein